MSSHDRQIALSPDVWSPLVVSALKTRDNGNILLMTYLRLCYLGSDNPKTGPILIPASLRKLSAEAGLASPLIRQTLEVFRSIGMVTEPEQENHSEEMPTEEEIEAYVKEKGLKVNPHRFYRYYLPSSFRYRGELMDWRVKLEEWNRNERPRAKRKYTTAAEYYAENRPVDTKDLEKAMKAI